MKHAWAVLALFAAHASAQAPSTPLRSIDWARRTYAPMRITQGEWELDGREPFGSIEDHGLWRLSQVAYGDVDGHAGEEAVLILARMFFTTDGHRSIANDVRVYGWDGAPIELTRGSVRATPVSIVTIERRCIVIAHVTGRPTRVSLREGELVRCGRHMP